MDCDEVDDQATPVAGDTEADPEPAGSPDNDTDEPRRSRLAWATAGMLVLGAVILVAVAGVVAWAIWPSAQPRRPALTPPTATSVVPGQAAPPPAAATPTAATPTSEFPSAAELSPSTTPQTPIEFTAADDQRLLNNLQQYGYPITDPENIARVAHTYCHALQRGETTEQADVEAAKLLANPADETAITAAASLALPHCNG